MDQDMAMSEFVSPSYSFSMLEMVTLDTAISYTFMCRNKRFILDISAEQLEGEGELVDTFYEFKDNLDDPDVLCDFETWVIDAVDEQIKRLAPPLSPSTRMPTTLLEYYDPETYVFELVNHSGLLAAIEHPYNPETHGNASPKAIILDFSPNSMPFESLVADQSSKAPGQSSFGDLTPDSEPAGGHCIVNRSTLPTVPFIPASHLARAAGFDSIEEEMCELPRIVRSINTNQEYFFKAANNRHGFQREIEVLCKFLDIAKHTVRLRTSKIVGLVNWDDQQDLLMGLLLEKITGKTLEEAIIDAPTTDKRKWMDQIDETASILHDNGLMWGDVKPDNVMIDLNGDAILVDFDGGENLRYMDPVLQRTMEGDLKGLKIMRAELLLDS